MFLLKKNCCRKIARRSCNLFYSSKEKVDQSESKSYNKNAKVSTSEPFCHYNGNCSDERNDIKLGIIGGGMAPIYTALLLKQSRLIKSINIADPNDMLAGPIYDASHIDTSTRIKYYGKKCLTEALIDVDIVALMDENDFDMGKTGPVSQFIATSNYVREMSDCMVKSCPSALVAVFARPITATLPMISEIYKFADWWDPNRILGSTAIDAMRIESMTASLFDLNPAFVTVPIVGGADPCTVVPLLSKARPVSQISPEHEATLIHQLRSADKELTSSVSRFKGPSLSTGAAAAKFILSLAGALCGRPNVTCSAYVRSDVLPVCRFFASELHLGRHGVEKNYGLPKVSPKAVDLIEQSVPYINELSEMAIDIVRNEKSAKLKV